MKLLVKYLRPGAQLTRAYSTDAGLDLYATFPKPETVSVMIPAGIRRSIPTGVAVWIPAGYVGLVCPRSGLAAKESLTVLNSPGVIDHGYTGELFVLLVNHGQSYAKIERGQRIGQLLVVPIPEIELEVVEVLPSSERGGQGFGSSGL